MSYEYLASTLPMLFFGDPPPFPVEDFVFRCSGVLSPEDHRTLGLLLAGRGDGRGGFADQWRARETQLRNLVARTRATRHGLDARALQHAHPGYDMGVDKGVTDAFVKATPLERELELDRTRWRVLDELGQRAPFGLDGVLAFGLKLQIAERWDALRDEAGAAVVEQLLQKADGGRAAEEIRHDGEDADDVKTESGRQEEGGA